MQPSRSSESIGLHTAALGISDSAFTLLRDLIADRLGVFYDDSKRDVLADKLSHATAAHGLQSFLDYYYLLKYDADAEQYWQELMNYLSVPETYFWRQADQFRALIDCVLPQHFATSREPLRIWSAACCTGEEPLSIAMAVREARLPPGARVDIIATDGSPAMVQRARAGLYGERSFRALAPEWRDRYFTKEARGWRVSRELHERIEWGVVNLLAEKEVAAMPCAQVVFCRNVFIYFSDAAIQRAARMISQRMPAGGHLFLGAAETLTRWPTDFSLEEVGGAFVYVNRRNHAVPRPEKIAS